MDAVGTVATTDFAHDVVRGLSGTPKFIPSKWFYDGKGSDLFRQITGLSVYYPTACERQIFELHVSAIVDEFGACPCNIIELGAGDGHKTMILLKEMVRRKMRVHYVPIDISADALGILRQAVHAALPTLAIEPVAEQYTQGLGRLKSMTGRCIVLFLGSSIGNFTLAERHHFLEQLRTSVRPGDLTMIGFDRRKDPLVMQPAYDDPEGVTRAFNFNLLTRINDELGGDIDLSTFRHHAVYSPKADAMQSFLLSTRAQQVRLASSGDVFHFAEWEGVHVEDSHKFIFAEIAALAAATGFRVVRQFSDKRDYFVDSVWEAI